MKALGTGRPFITGLWLPSVQLTYGFSSTSGGVSFADCRRDLG
jgi:hypothetical protein